MMNKTVKQVGVVVYSEGVPYWLREMERLGHTCIRQRAVQPGFTNLIFGCLPGQEKDLQRHCKFINHLYLSRN